jgi:CRP-like cAMP-binding protein
MDSPATETAKSRFEVDPSDGHVKLVLEAPTTSSGNLLTRENTETPNSAMMSPQRTLRPADSMDSTDNASEEVIDHMEDFVSIAQPLKQHGSVFLNKLSLPASNGAAGASATPATTPVHRHHHDPAPVYAAAPGTPENAFSSPPIHHLAADSLSPSRHTHSQLHSFLCTVPHLSVLPIEDLDSLRVMVREYDALDTVIEPGTTLQHVYVIASGTVEVFDPRASNRVVTHKRIATITAPNIFGMDSLVFDTPCEFSCSASTNTTILLISKAQFLELFSKNTMFAHSVGSRLTMNLPQFNVFQDFCRAVFAMSSVVAGQTDSTQYEGYTLHLPTIMACYMNIGTVIHPLVHKAEIDINALRYASMRLPANITETFVINLARSLPPFLATELRMDHFHRNSGGAGGEQMNNSFNTSEAYGSEQANVTFVPTASRRRSSWRIGDKGHTLVLMRDGFTDIVDFMTSLCIHLVEARKLRIRLQSMIAPSAADVLKSAMQEMKAVYDTRRVEDMQRNVLEQLPLTPAERLGLADAWPHSAIQKLYNIIMHQEQYIVKVDTSLSKRFASDPYLQWSLTIRSSIYRMLGVSESEALPSHVEVHILSSRNRTTKSLLCSLAETHKDEIDAYYEQVDASSRGFNWTNECDKRYYALFRMINEIDVLRHEYSTVLKSCGFQVFEDQRTSGLQLDLLDASRLDVARVDPYLRDTVQALKAESNKKRRFLVNIDFTFGAQAESIMRSLFLTFGHHVASVNVVGKCAGISGSRGDVLLPSGLLFSKTAFGEDTTDEIRRPGNLDLSADTLKSLISENRKVHTGYCVTIPGMILQNEALIRFYKTVYGCDGLEMEGSYVARQIEECANLGLLSKSVRTRYVFFMSDMPVGNEDGSKRTKGAESIVTMYATLRATLKAILSQ